MADFDGRDVFVHPGALCETGEVGSGTRIWAFAHVMSGAVVGEQCNLGNGVFVESGAVIGSRVTVKNNVSVWNGVTVENDVFLGPAAVLTNDRHPRSLQGRADRQDNLDRILIREGASVGAGAVIIAPVTVGSQAMIGAGAVVTRDVPAHALMIGNPARRVAWVCECTSRLNRDLDCPVCGLRYVPRQVGGLTRR